LFYFGVFSAFSLVWWAS